MHQRGFTLIETMVVVAIVGILSGLGFAAYSNVSAASAPQNAAADSSAALAKARSMAQERNEDVWVIIYENIDSAGTAGAGNGAYFIFEDPDLTFNASSPAAVSGEVRYATFSPPGTVDSTAMHGHLLLSKYMDDYPKKAVKFANVSTAGLTFSAPFSGVTIGAACSFCNGNPKRGAIVFGGDGRARFFDGSGAEQVRGSSTSAGRSAYVGLGSTDTAMNRAYAYIVSGPTGYIGTFSK